MKALRWLVQLCCMRYFGDPASQTAAAQQFNQQQAEQYLTQQKQDALSGLMSYLGQNPDPASQWGAIAQPNFSYNPTAIGGGTTNAAGGISGMLGGWTPTPPQGTPPLLLPQQALAKSAQTPPSSATPGKTTTPGRVTPATDPGDIVARAIGGPTSTGLRM